MKVRALAIFCSDIHLSIKPPTFRSEEPDWLLAMARPLRELRSLAKKLGTEVIFSGDLFDRWNSPPELISFAMQELPKIYAIPGQHDLPNHVYEDIEKSAYYCLVEAGTIRHIEPFSPVRTEWLELYGFPWSFNPEPCLSDSDLIKIAIVHQYCWIGKFRYVNAPDENNIKNFKFSGYDAVAIGDNHLGWIQGKVCNCGGFMRRTTADLDRHPFVGVLMSNGEIKKHLLDTSDDVYSPGSEHNVVETGSLEIGQFTEGLLGLRDSQDLDFAQVVKRYCRKTDVPGEVVSVINKAIEDESK